MESLSVFLKVYAGLPYSSSNPSLLEHSKEGLYSKHGDLEILYLPQALKISKLLF